MAENTLVQLNFEVAYVFNMLSLGCILISDLVANLFMHSLSDRILLYLVASLFKNKGIFA